MRILIYGGTFNPVHQGHLNAVTRAAESLGPEKIFFIPTSIPPHKALAAGSPPAADRVGMLECVCAQLPGARVLDMELKREGPSYTADTLRALKDQYPENELIFLLGTDMLLSLLTWHEPETVMACASLAVYAREDDRGEEIRTMAERLRQEYGATVYVLSGPSVEASSTEIRAALPKREGRDLVPAPVYGYIIRRRLYGAKPDLDWLRSKAYPYLKPKRVAHVQGVEAEALELAARWGVDPGDAAEAAICHDITKKLARDEQLRLCDKYAIMTDEYERGSEKLLHAKTGAAFAADQFGLSDDVALAIRFHTTGRTGMTTLEQITYLADYIEPGRYGFAGLAELRAVCYEDLDQAMELASRMSIDEVRGKGYEPHRSTVDCHEWYRNNLRRRGLAPVRAQGIPDEV